MSDIFSINKSIKKAYICGFVIETENNYDFLDNFVMEECGLKFFMERYTHDIQYHTINKQSEIYKKYILNWNKIMKSNTTEQEFIIIKEFLPQIAFNTY